MRQTYQYQGIDTCAATGLCAQRCPVGINTGELVKKLRSQAAEHEKPPTGWPNTSTALGGARLTLTAANTARKLLGAPRLGRLSASLHKASKGRLPKWTPAMPQLRRTSARPATTPALAWCTWLPASRG
ncbi:(Fe-S)-binding protein [Pseudomonas asiatica]|uniref:(Fe-S)-binding protein n=1 Tax=Pseudomonas asiatica TaxID=2219225 RepID=UPI0020C20EE7|nr:(Fe-S)-binding protein [Pseudomonas asiatica]